MKITIFGNIASQGILLANKFKYDDVTIFHDKSKILNNKSIQKQVFSKNPFYNIWKRFILTLKSNLIIFNFPVGFSFWQVFYLAKILKIPLIPYFHGSDLRNRSISDLNKISSYCKNCFYSTPDLKILLENVFENSELIPCKSTLEFNSKKKVLIFSRNDSFKKTDEYFPKISLNPNTEYHFIDWFSDHVYKALFISRMPDNAKIIPFIPNDLVPQVLRGYDDVFGQRSGFKGVSEQEIEKYYETRK